MPARLLTPDGRYVVIRGRLWRTSDPRLAPEERAALVSALMTARRDVGSALRTCQVEAQTEARRRVQAAKVALGERGPVWWDDGAPDFNRRMVANTPYAKWFEGLPELGGDSL